MKCVDCEIALTEDNTYKVTRNRRCRTCFNAAQAERFRQNKARLVEAKGGKCFRCGYDKYFGALDFHHLDPAIKDKGAGRLRMWKFDRAMKELESCILLCRNCHAELHFGE